MIKILFICHGINQWLEILCFQVFTEDRIEFTTDLQLLKVPRYDMI